MIAQRFALALAAGLLAASCTDVPDNAALDTGDADTATPMATAPDAASSSDGESSAAPGEPVEAAIYGRWDVTAARLTNPDGPVQAYGTDQLRALQDLELTVERNAVRWSGAPLTDDAQGYIAFTMACDTPQPAALGDAGGVTLTCADGDAFGPPGNAAEPVMQLDGDDDLTVRWFDGVTLELRRAQ